MSQRTYKDKVLDTVAKVTGYSSTDAGTTMHMETVEGIIFNFTTPLKDFLSDRFEEVINE